jgi:hypothetical protein
LIYNFGRKFYNFLVIDSVKEVVFLITKKTALALPVFLNLRPASRRKLLVGDGGLAAKEELDALVPILYGLEVR